MNRIIQLLIKNHVFFLFIILQLISFQLLVTNHFVAENQFLTQLSNIKSKLFLKESEFKKYFELQSINTELLKTSDSLFKENTYLKNELLLLEDDSAHIPELDSILTCQAKVLRNSWNKKRNFITINKGAAENLKSNMGVVNHNGLIGITNTVSENFATIISLINTSLTISAKIKNSGKFGTLNWNGKDASIMQLTGLPKNVNLKVGDTVVTSSYSNILPENLNIGTVLSYESEKNTNFLTVSVDLFVDFKNLNFVQILQNSLQNERELIEKTILN